MVLYGFMLLLVGSWFSMGLKGFLWLDQFYTFEDGGPAQSTTVVTEDNKIQLAKPTKSTALTGNLFEKTISTNHQQIPLQEPYIALFQRP